MFLVSDQLINKKKQKTQHRQTNSVNEYLWS